MCSSSALAIIAPGPAKANAASRPGKRIRRGFAQLIRASLADGELYYYFLPQDGQRTALFICDVPDESQLVTMLEPFFSNLEAQVDVHPVMNLTTSAPASTGSRAAEFPSAPDLARHPPPM